MSLVLTLLCVGVFVAFLANTKFDILNLSKANVEMRKAQSKYFISYKPLNLKNAFDQLSASISPLSSILGGKNELSALQDKKESGTAKSIPVLAYHGIPSGGEEGFVVPLPLFIDHMRTLKKAGWETITMEDFYSFIYNGKELPDKSFLLTFDDGRKDTYYPVDPVLKDLEYYGVMFVITGSSFPKDKNTTYYVNKTELAKMKESGRWGLESHGDYDHGWYPIDAAGTLSHFLSNRLWLSGEGRLETKEEYVERITADLLNSKEMLEKNFGGEVLGFAYPFNDFGQGSENFFESRDILAKIIPSIYKMGFYQHLLGDGDVFNYPDPGSFMIKRIEPLQDWDGKHLLKVMESGRAKSLPYLSERFEEEWIGTWGKTEASGPLVLTAEPYTTGATAVLNGTFLWEDYIYTADVSRGEDGDVLLMARYQDNTKYLVCAFSANRVAIQERLNGETRFIRKTEYRADTTDDVVSLSISVKNDDIGCYVDGELVLESGPTSPALRNGGIGIQVWNRVEGVARIVVNKITVNPI